MDMEQLKDTWVAAEEQDGVRLRYVTSIPTTFFNKEILTVVISLVGTFSLAVA